MVQAFFHQQYLPFSVVGFVAIQENGAHFSFLGNDTLSYFSKVGTGHTTGICPENDCSFLHVVYVISFMAHRVFNSTQFEFLM